MAFKGTETDVLYGVAMDRAVMAYKGTETDVLYGVEMEWKWRGVLMPLLTHCSREASLFNCQMTECYRYREEIYREETRGKLCHADIFSLLTIENYINSLFY